MQKLVVLAAACAVSAALGAWMTVSVSSMLCGEQSRLVTLAAVVPQEALATSRKELCKQAVVHGRTMKQGPKIKAVESLLEWVESVPGDIIEAGVAEGGGSLPLIFLLGCTGQMRTRTFHLFDSWSGLPPPKLKEDEGFQEHMWNKTFDQFTNSTAWFESQYNTRVKDLPGAMSWAEVWQHVQVHRGFFSDQMPFALMNRRVALLMCDGDMYESSRDCLAFAGPLVNKGGWIYHDDFFSFLGNYKAVMEYIAASPRQHSPITMVPKWKGPRMELNLSVCKPPKHNKKGGDGSCQGTACQAGFFQVLSD